MMEVFTSKMQLCDGHLEQVIAFFKESLNLEVEQLSESQAVVNQDCGAPIFLSTFAASNEAHQIQLTTSDCIALYCLLKSKGIVFKQSPSYSPKGMVAEFSDAFNKQYFLIEPRNYSE